MPKEFHIYFQSILCLIQQMPEEQAFCVLVNMMFEYGLRDLFRDGFEILHMRFYQLGKLIEVREREGRARISECNIAFK